MNISANLWTDREVTNEDLEGAARGIQKMLEGAAAFPEYHEQVLGLRRMVAKAAKALVEGRTFESTMIYGELKRRRAEIVSGKR